MTDETKDAVVGRYARGQTISFIAFATGLPVAKVRAVLAERGVTVERNCKRNRAWGYRGGGILR